MKTRTRVLSWLGILLLAIVVSSCTQEDESAEIYGFVYNSAGVGLRDVTVEAGPAIAFTNASGYYELEWVEPGSRTITFSKDGYIDMQASMVLVSGAKKEVNMALSVPGWLGSWFSGSFGANFSAGGPSLGNTDQNTDFDYNGTDVFTPNRADGILDLGPVVDLAAVDHVPTTGYQQSLKAFAGNAYAVRTTEGNYVKLRISAIGIGMQEVYFDWYYQANGGVQF